MTAEHVCWLIETTATPTPLYFSGWNWEQPREAKPFKFDKKDVPKECFTADADAGAIRFPTKASAQNMLIALMGGRLGDPVESAMSILRAGLSCYRVAEHVFDYTPP